jgi:hypothetical protein
MVVLAYSALPSLPWNAGSEDDDPTSCNVKLGHFPQDQINHVNIYVGLMRRHYPSRLLE